jgi:hypothetical protein
MKRKTISVEKMKDSINLMLATNTCSPEVRRGMASVLESVLGSTGNYKGYWMLRPDEVPPGQKPGIIFDESKAGNHQYPDDSRRRYY